MTKKNIHNLKVIEQSGYHYKPTPTIQLKGQWLKEFGFEIGTEITVTCEDEDGRMVITPRAAEVELFEYDARQFTMVAEGKEGYCK